MVEQLMMDKLVLAAAKAHHQARIGENARGEYQERRLPENLCGGDFIAARIILKAVEHDIRQLGSGSLPRPEGFPLGDGPSFAHDVKPLEEELALAKAHPEYGIDVEAVEAALREAKGDAAGKRGEHES